MQLMKRKINQFTENKWGGQQADNKWVAGRPKPPNVNGGYGAARVRHPRTHVAEQR